MQNADEWGQGSYQESMISSMPELSFNETFDITDLAPGPPGDNVSGPKVSDGGGLYPKGSIGKPIRRRSRASKRAPTTLLTADANNFRALVQQFTGCHSARPGFGARKGPINLNFEQFNYYSGKRAESQQPKHDQESDQSLVSFSTNNAAATITTTTTRTDDHRPDLLSVDDDFDFENFSLSEAGDYSAVLSETRVDDLWGY